MRLSWVIQVGSKSSEKNPYMKQEEKTEIQGEGPVKVEAEIGLTLIQASTWSHQKLGEARKDSPLGLSEGSGPASHLDFGLLASRTVK